MVLQAMYMHKKVADNAVQAIDMHLRWQTVSTSR
jgi:hypothetical protein